MPETNVGLQPNRVIMAGDGPGVLVNRDLINTVILGLSNTITGDNPNSVSVLDPLVGIPFSGDTDIWAATITNAPVTVDYILGALAWNPSPGQQAAQLAAIAASTAATAANTAATETAVAGVNTTLGSPPQNATVVNPNPALTGGSNVGYTAFNATNPPPVTATPLPGCPAAYALIITPNGASTQPNFTGGAFPATVGQFYMCRPAVCLPFTDANVINLQAGFDWYSDQAGTVKIGTSVTSFTVPPANQWVWLNSGSPGFQAPAGTVTAKFKIIMNGTVAVAAADVWQAAAMYAYTLQPGVPAQDSTLAHLHDRISITGINGSLPVLLDTEVLSATSGAWGTFTKTLPGACASYLITILPTTFANTVCSDFTVNHLDAAGNVVHTDFFGAVPGGTWAGVGGSVAAAVQMGGPTLLRGNIYGTQLQISGLKAAAAFVNTITGLSGAVMSGFTYRLYTLPYNVPDAMPKMSNGSAVLATTQTVTPGASPGNLIASWVNASIVTTASFESIILPYAGPAILLARTSTSTIQIQIFGYSVINGTSKLWEAVFDIAIAASGIPSSVRLNLPACLTQMLINSNGAGTASANVSIVSATSV